MERKMMVNLSGRSHAKFVWSLLGMLLLISFSEPGESRPSPASDIKTNIPYNYSGPFSVSVSQLADPSLIAGLEPVVVTRQTSQQLTTNPQIIPGTSDDDGGDGEQANFNLEQIIFVPSLLNREEVEASENLAPQSGQTGPMQSLIQRKRKNLYNSQPGNQLVNGDSEDDEKIKSRNKKNDYLVLERQVNTDNAQLGQNSKVHLVENEKTKEMDTAPIFPVEIKFHAVPFIVSPPVTEDDKTFLHEKPGPLSLLDELGTIL